MVISQPGPHLLALPCRVPATSRLAQIVRWLKGSSAPPLLVFDEARLRERPTGCLLLDTAQPIPACWSGVGGMQACCVVLTAQPLLPVLAPPLPCLPPVPQGQEPAAQQRRAAHHDRQGGGGDTGAAECCQTSAQLVSWSVVCALTRLPPCGSILVLLLCTPELSPADLLPLPFASAKQEQLPDAKVLYSSATGASEPKNLA